MGDDGVAIKIAEKLTEEIKLTEIDIIIGETDIDYCISNINNNDYLFILDATYFGIEPGAITVIPLDKPHLYLKHSFTQHDLNLIKLLTMSEKKVFGYIIGIEIEEIKFDLNLSKTLSNKLNNICDILTKMILSMALNTYP